MPCWESNVMSVEFKADQFALLDKAAKAIGLRATASQGYAIIHTPQGDVLIQDGKASGPVQAVERFVNDLRVQYSKEIVRAVGLKQGWSVQQVNNNKFVVKKA